MDSAYEFISIGVLAEFAKTVRTVLDISSYLCDVGLSTAFACLAGWRGESGEFVGCADDLPAVHGDS
jgi:hypothetical protein